MTLYTEHPNWCKLRKNKNIKKSFSITWGWLLNNFTVFDKNQVRKVICIKMF